MTDEKNRAYVAMTPGLDCRWSFVAPSEVSRLSDVQDEYADVLCHLYDSFEGFFNPTEIEYVIQSFPDDGPAASAFPSYPDNSEPEIYTDSITDDGGVSYEQLMKEVSDNRVQESHVSHLSTFEFSGLTKIYVGDSFHDISVNNTDKFKVWGKDRGLRPDRNPSYDPITVSVRRSPHLNSGDSIDNTEYTVIVKAFSDIWFEETEIGRINRAQLVAFISRLYSGLSIQHIDYANAYAREVVLEFTDDSVFEGY